MCGVKTFPNIFCGQLNYKLIMKSVKCFDDSEFVPLEVSDKYNKLFDSLNGSKFHNIGTTHENNKISVNVEIINYLRCGLILLQAEISSFISSIYDNNVAVAQSKILKNNIIESYFDQDLYKDIQSLKKYKKMINSNDDDFCSWILSYLKCYQEHVNRGEPQKEINNKDIGKKVVLNRNNKAMSKLKNKINMKRSSRKNVTEFVDESPPFGLKTMVIDRIGGISSEARIMPLT